MSIMIQKPLGFLVAGLLLSGCANQHQLDSAQDTIRGYQQRTVELEEQVRSLDAHADQLRDQVKQANGRTMVAQRNLTATRTNLQRLQSEFQGLEADLNRIDPVMLPVQIDRKLRDLADRNPSLLTYDPRRGMIRLASDLTFELGSEVVRPEAATSLAILADIVNNDDAAGFEIRIVGHTDNVPIRRAVTKVKHPTNMHLAVHRAISVRDVLVKQGLAANRLSVAGWGQYRPIVANPATGGGAVENRRVELFLVPMIESAIAKAGEGEVFQVKVELAKDEPMK